MRTDWAAKAAAVLASLPPKVTAKTDETPESDATKGLSSVLAVHPGHHKAKPHTPEIATHCPVATAKTDETLARDLVEGLSSVLTVHPGDQKSEAHESEIAVRSLKVTAKTDETSGTVAEEGLSSVLTVHPGHEHPESHAPSTANQWRLYYAGERIREITFSPARTEAQVRADYPDALALLEIATTVASCALCGHASRYGNCGEPVAAGLAASFCLTKHPDAGRGCKHFRSADC